MRGAEERTWEVVRRAYADRPARPSHRRLSNSLLLALVCSALLVAAAVVSPPGRAVFERMRQAVGVEHAAPAIFSLPSHGDLLVVSGEHGGVWLVRDNGLKRRIGSYDDAQWSPHGKFIVATKGDELVALDPDGEVHWTLARPGVRWPRWEGTDVDTRVAYVDRDGLRVVAGDGTGDHGLDRLGGGVPPAWDPARLHTLAYHAPGSIVMRRDDGKLVWRFKLPDAPTSLAWSRCCKSPASAPRRSRRCTTNSASRPSTNSRRPAKRAGSRNSKGSARKHRAKFWRAFSSNAPTHRGTC